MPQYEYKVVPAPTKGTKSKAQKTPAGRFALSVEAVLNDMGSDGWEYLRAELLPSEERSGLTGTTTNWRNVLVFRRALESTNALDGLDEMLPEPSIADAVALIEPRIAATVAVAPIVAPLMAEPAPYVAPQPVAHEPVALPVEPDPVAAIMAEPVYEPEPEPYEAPVMYDEPAPQEPEEVDGHETTVLMPLPNIRPD